MTATIKGGANISEIPKRQKGVPRSRRTAPRMSAEAFRNWLWLMWTTRGWPEELSAAILGCGENTIRIWCEKGAPAYIGFACRAIAEGSWQWGPGDGKPSIEPIPEDWIVLE